MISKKIIAFSLFWIIFFTAFSSVSLFADWQEVVKRHLGAFPVYDRLIEELTAQFRDIKEKEKGAAALILAYAASRATKKSAIFTPIENYFDKAAALENKEVSAWLKRYFVEFKAADDDLLFLSPEREAVRRDILSFREECKKEFPLITVESEILDLQSFIKIKLRLRSPVNCGCEIYAENSSLLAEGILKKGLNERIVQLKKNSPGKQEGFIRVLAFNKYMNEQKITFKYPDTAGRLQQPKKHKIKYSAPNLKKKIYYGFTWSPFLDHEFYVYRNGSREPAGKEGSRFFESDLSFSVILKNAYEVGLFYRKLEAEKVLTAEGLWSAEESLLGLTAGKVFTIKDAAYKFFLDFSGGGFIARSLKSDYSFLEPAQDDKAAPAYYKTHYGIYANVGLRLNLLRKIKKPEIPIITIGFKYFFSFNRFGFRTDTDDVYRLQRKFFYIGFYFR